MKLVLYKNQQIRNRCHVNVLLFEYHRIIIYSSYLDKVSSCLCNTWIMELTRFIHYFFNEGKKIPESVIWFIVLKFSKDLHRIHTSMANSS